MSTDNESILVTYKFVDGLHFFVGGDKKAAGLCVANTDLSVAYAEVGEQLTKIVSFNNNEEVAPFQPAIPLEKFQQMVDAYVAVTNLVGDYDIKPSSTQSWIHSVHREKEVA
jgi:hypothetical protein